MPFQRGAGLKLSNCYQTRPENDRMTDKQNKRANDNRPDLTRLIRSVQRIEGNPDCFGTAECNGERSDCAWYEYCLKDAKKDR